MGSSIEIRPLVPRDDRSGFHCGHPDLDRFFLRFAGQNQFRHHLGVTYVAIRGKEIVGFATVSPSEIEAEGLSATVRRRLPHYPLPVLRLARLAVDERAQGQGVGKGLLRFTLRLALRMSSDFGCAGVVVDAKPDAIDFYRSLGFEPMQTLEGALLERPKSTSMFLPISAIPLS